eukprot:755282-Hanusia_phi.AAC.3
MSPVASDDTIVRSGSPLNVTKSPIHKKRDEHAKSMNQLRNKLRRSHDPSVVELPDQEAENENMDDLNVDNSWFNGAHSSEEECSDEEQNPSHVDENHEGMSNMSSGVFDADSMDGYEHEPAQQNDGEEQNNHDDEQEEEYEDEQEQTVPDVAQPEYHGQEIIEDEDEVYEGVEEEQEEESFQIEDVDNFNGNMIDGDAVVDPEREEFVEGNFHPEVSVDELCGNEHEGVSLDWIEDEDRGAHCGFDHHNGCVGGELVQERHGEVDCFDSSVAAPPPADDDL